MLLTMLPVIFGFFIFIFLPEIMHQPMFRWHEGLLILIITVLIEFPYARYALRPIARRVMLPVETKTAKA
jgi:hypothetical protein